MSTTTTTTTTITTTRFPVHGAPKLSPAVSRGQDAPHLSWSFWLNAEDKWCESGSFIINDMKS